MENLVIKLIVEIVVWFLRNFFHIFDTDLLGIIAIVFSIVLFAVIKFTWKYICLKYRNSKKDKKNKA